MVNTDVRTLYICSPLIEVHSGVSTTCRFTWRGVAWWPPLKIYKISCRPPVDIKARRKRDEQDGGIFKDEQGIQKHSCPERIESEGSGRRVGGDGCWVIGVERVKAND